MEMVAKAIIVALAALVLLFGAYSGARTFDDPLWFVQWRNRLNGDPRDYPPEYRDQWWARWNLAYWDPDQIQSSPARLAEFRIFGLVILVVSAFFLIALIGFAAHPKN